MNIAIFTFNGFQENTYILYDASGACAIVDPGCNDANERQALIDFIDSNQLKPQYLLNTHCHIDHILGNKFVSERFDLALTSHKGEIPVLSSGVMVSQMYGISYEPSPDISIYIDEGDEISFGYTKLEVLFTPGHSPASVSFFHRETNQLIAGDVLFQGSIGRTDLPGGDYDTLIKSINQKYFPLGDEVIVYPGHGPSTTIGKERSSNPFLV